MRRGAALTAWTCAGLLAALLAWRLTETPALILFAALIPALAYSLAIVRIGHFGRHPAVLLLVMLLWGAGAAAVLASGANDAAQTWLGELRDAEQARALTPRLAAPAIEELIKAVPLVILALALPAEVGVVGGMIYGALIGIGFTMAENVTYFILAAVQGGELGLIQSIYLRGVLGGLNHAAFTATVGAALGWAAIQGGTKRWALPLIGLAIAIVEHAIWNALAADAINDLICNAVSPGSACRTPATPMALFVGAPLIVALCIGPPLLALVVWARRARRDDTAQSSNPSTTPI